ncbi:type II secretion system protein GspG [Polaromonas sp. LjRoot131]
MFSRRLGPGPLGNPRDRSYVHALPSAGGDFDVLSCGKDGQPGGERA